MMTETDFDVAIVGLDSPYWPTAFAETIPELSRGTLVGATDLGVDADAVEANVGMTTEEYIAEYDVERLGDLESALETADAILVCTRNTRMPEVIIQAVRSDTHVFAAKPIGVSVDDLQQIETATSPSTVVTAGQTGRSDPAIRAMLEEVQAGRIGDVHTLRVMHQHGRVHDWTAGTWYTDSTEGNACNWLGWYTLDIATAILGPITELSGHAQRLVDADDDQPDHLKAVATHAAGRQSTMDVYCDIDTEWEIPMLEAEIVGSHGVIRYHGPGSDVHVHGDDGVETIAFEEGDNLAYDLRQWLSACAGQGDPVLPTAQALHVSAAGCAWNEASTSPGRRASVEMVPQPK